MRRIYHNYRRIAVTNTMSNIFRRIMRIKDQFKGKDSEEKCSFGEGEVLCINNLLILAQIVQKLERGSNVHLMFLKIAKAYETVLLSKLWETLEDNNFAPLRLGP